MDTSETGLEKIIVGWLVKENGYEQESPHAYNKDFALVDKWVEDRKSTRLNSSH